MEGKLAGLKQDLVRCQLRVERLCRSLRGDLNTALITVDELDVPQIGQQTRDLELAYMEMQSVLSRISRLKKELGHG